MPYRSPASARSVTGQAGPGTITPSVSNNPLNYVPTQSGVWRHQFTQGATYPGAGVLITQQVYAILELAKFERSFSGTDGPPTPVANTNNFTSTKCFNGSRIGKYNCNIILRNETPSTPVYLDVYMIALSFEEAYLWNAIWAAACPVSQIVTLGGAAAGDVTTKAPTIGFIDRQTVQDSNWLKRFIKPMGTITVPSVESGGVAEVNINTVPPKIRRSNSGMYWAIAFANDALKNQGDKSVRIIGTYDFEEFPSSSRATQFPG